MKAEEIKSNVLKFFENDYYDSSSVDVSDSDFKKLENDSSLYLLYCYWDSGCNFTIATLDEVKNTCNDCLNRSEDEAYQMMVFDSQGNPRSIYISDIQLSKIPGY